MTRTKRATWAICLSLLGGATALGQGFVSGSDGSDGALSFPANAGVVVFNPTTLGVDADGDGVYHFTTIDVPAGTTVRLAANVLGEGKPVVWLASGAVEIQGTVDLSGQAGHNFAATRLPGIAGAGGFNGGPGATPTLAPRPGNGPGGGATQAGKKGGCGSFLGQGGTGSTNAPSGATYGNRFLLPLIGGSGGGGGNKNIGSNGSGGGGGGGALLIASSVSINLTGTIDARGGNGGDINVNSTVGGGGGSGGAVRLMAPDLTGLGSVNVTGGATTFQSCSGAPGLVRLEAFRSTITNVLPTNSVDSSRPANVFPPANAPKVRISQIGTTTITTQNPKGGYVVPDATINESGPVTITIEANNIPLGTQLQLTLCPEGGTPITVTTTALSGTVGTSTATVGPLTIPSGFSRFFLVATWTP